MVSIRIILSKFSEFSEQALKTLDILKIISKMEPSLNPLSYLTLTVLKLRTVILGEEHLDTITAEYNLSIIYSKVGRIKDALELGQKVYDIRNRLLGEEHPVTILAIYNLSMRYYDMGMKDDAILMAKKVLELRTKILGEENPDTKKAQKRLDLLVELK